MAFDVLMSVKKLLTHSRWNYRIVYGKKFLFLLYKQGDWWIGRRRSMLWRRN